MEICDNSGEGNVDWRINILEEGLGYLLLYLLKVASTLLFILNDIRLLGKYGSGLRDDMNL